MMTDRALPSCLQMLAARWQIWSLMLVALARQVTLADKQGAACGIHKAACLEAMLYAALVELSSDIARASDPRSSRDTQALQYLQVIYVLLSAIALMIRQIRADLEAAFGRLAALRGDVLISVDALLGAPINPPTYLDSS